MKNLVKFSFVLFAALAFSSCGKTEFANVTPDTAGNVATKIHHTEDADDNSSGDLFTDKDKCKKCHSAPKLMGIDWTAPYMSDNRYSSIEELVNNFDFVNNVHVNFSLRSIGTSSISAAQKQELINYLKGMAAQQASEANSK